MSRLEKVCDNPGSMEKILKESKEQRIVIDGHDVKKWASLCDESVERCVVPEPNLVETRSEFTTYKAHCEVKLAMFCLDKFDRVIESFTKSEENRRLMSDFVHYYRQANEVQGQNNSRNPFARGDKAFYDTFEAYTELVKSRQAHVSDSKKNNFLFKIKNVAKIYREFSKSKWFTLANKLEMNRTKTGWYEEAGRISGYFIDSVYGRIRKAKWDL